MAVCSGFERINDDFCRSIQSCRGYIIGGCHPFLCSAKGKIEAVVGRFCRKPYFCCANGYILLIMNNVDWVNFFTNPFYLLIVYLSVANIITFLLYGVDKVKAKRGWMRISETTLLLMAILGGSLGALFGMNIWHHKTNHWKFTIGVPLVLLCQIALVVWIYIALNQTTTM